MKLMKMFYGVVAAMILLSVQTLSAQTKIKITGVVTDENGEPLVGVAVMDADKKLGTVTDAEGKYSISVPEKTILLYDYIGYKKEEYKVGGGRTVVNITMVEDRTFLEEAVVVGYGTVRRSDLTGSVSSVSSKSI